MKKQTIKQARAVSSTHTILLLGKNQDRLKTIAQWVAGPDRVIIMARSRQAMHTVFDFENVGLTIVDLDNAKDLSSVIPSLKRKRDMPLVLLRGEQAAQQRRRPSPRSFVSTITKPISPLFLEGEIAPLLH